MGFTGLSLQHSHIDHFFGTEDPAFILFSRVDINPTAVEEGHELLDECRFAMTSTV